MGMRTYEAKEARAVAFNITVPAGLRLLFKDRDEDDRWFGPDAPAGPRPDRVQSSTFG